MSTTTVANIYNPKNQSKEELISSFVVRRNLFERLFKEIKSSEMKHPEQHYLITGKRGMGKTTLLYRLGYEIENDPKLNTWLIPIIFNEEEYSIRKLFRFWERTIDLLEEKHPNLFTELADEVENLRKLHKDDDQYERILFERLEKTLEGKGKKLLLFIDNFGDIFNKFSDSEAHRLRKILQTCACLRIMAASSVVLEAFYEYNHPFYEFFKEVKLEGLSAEETKSLLLKLGETYKEESVRRIVEEQPGRIEALRRITGGVIRSIVLLFEIFVDDEDGSAIRDLMGILDRVTPLYKDRMDDLSPIQQQIVEAIALSWDAINVGEIAEQTRMESKLVSAHLTPLVNNGIVSKITTDKKNHLYQLDERFFNIWYLMRFGSRYDRKRVVWLVRFFEEWCDGNALEERIKCHITALKSKPYDPQSAWFITEALAKTRHIPLKLQHELLMETRAFLAGKSNELFENLSQSDYELLELAANAYLEEKIEEALLYLERMKIKHSFQAFMGDGALSFTSARNSGKVDSLFSFVFFNLGNLYYYEHKDFLKAEDWYKKSADGGNVNSMFRLGFLYDELEDYLNSQAWYLKAAEKGDKLAMNNLGALYQGVFMDFENAEKWYMKSVAKGFNYAMTNLGNLYQNDFNDIQKAEFCFLKAAEEGDSEAMVRVGGILQLVKRELKKAEEWYLKAAEKNNSDAMACLGSLYHYEYKDFRKAEEWHLKAAEKGHTGAMVNLSRLFQDEYKNVKEAEEWLRKAVEIGDAKAMSNLGVLYETEYKDERKAEEWYLKALEKDPAQGNNYAWVLFMKKKDKSFALDIAHKAYFGHEKTSFVAHTLACIQLWNNQFQAAEALADKFMYDTELMEKTPEDYLIFLQLLLAKNRYDFLYNAFTSEQGKEVHLQDRFKPIWYALLKRMNHPDYLRIGSELEETVNEILQAVDQMAIDYA